MTDSHRAMKRDQERSHQRLRTRTTMRMAASVLVTASLLAACGSDTATSTEAPADATTAAPTTTTAITTTVPATTTTAAPTTTVPATTTTVELSALEDLGYPVSDEYVVETIVRDLDSATGGLVFDADGNMYQADFGYGGHPGDAVYRIAPDGTIETFAQSEEMNALTANTFGPDGTLYQSSYRNGQVLAIDTAGNVEVVAEDLGGPTGILVDEDGSLLVESYDRRIIYRILPDGTVTEWARDAQFNGPNGLAAGPDGLFYAVNHRDGSLFEIDADGTVTLLHTFPKPTSHLVYLDGSLFIASRGAFVVYRYELATGDIEVIAGDATPNDQDGRGSEASFGRPNAIAIGPDGALYTNHGDGETNSPVSIRRISHEP